VQSLPEVTTNPKRQRGRKAYDRWPSLTLRVSPDRSDREVIATPFLRGAPGRGEGVNQFVGQVSSLSRTRRAMTGWKPVPHFFHRLGELQGHRHQRLGRPSAREQRFQSFSDSLRLHPLHLLSKAMANCESAWHAGECRPDRFPAVSGNPARFPAGPSNVTHDASYGSQKISVLGTAGGRGSCRAGHAARQPRSPGHTRLIPGGRISRSREERTDSTDGSWMTRDQISLSTKPLGGRLWSGRAASDC
jgi:hypothetical protein